MLAVPITTRWHCIRCNNTWGGLVDISSYGVCIDCLSIWITDRKRAKGLEECFGKHTQLETVDCLDCSVNKYCQEYVLNL